MRHGVITEVVLIAGLMAGTLADTAWAQGQPAVMAPAQGQPAPMTPPLAPAEGRFKVGSLMVEPVEMGEPVENAAYSADIVNEVTQELRDGNRIERRATGTVARDSRGRVRREQQLSAIGPVVPDGDARMITISDPAARVHYSLDPGRKVAIRSRRAAPGDFSKRAPAGMGPGVPGEPGSSEVRTEQLGVKEHDGVRAEGTRTIATIPAGSIGNVRPIEIVSERWYSPELRVVLFSRRADPRSGETIYRLTNITRAEPDASLFQVPADYKIEDASGSRNGH